MNDGIFEKKMLIKMSKTLKFRMTKCNNFCKKNKFSKILSKKIAELNQGAICSAKIC